MSNAITRVWVIPHTSEFDPYHPTVADLEKYGVEITHCIAREERNV